MQFIIYPSVAERDATEALAEERCLSLSNGK